MKILIADDEPKMGIVLTEFLETLGHDARSVTFAAAALEELEKDPPDLVVTDLKMPGMNGLELLQEIKKRRRQTEVLIMTAYATTGTAVEAMRRGAFDYLIKPLDMDELGARVAKVEERVRILDENRTLKQSLANRYDFSRIIGTSKAMRDVLSLASKVIQSDATVLISGESGTGKEILARAIHYNGPRRDGPFIEVNCSALPESLMESELFGHRKGSFTGAVRDKKGLFQAAHGGTIFLDEIGEISLSVQVTLLRVLQTREITPIGSTDKVRVDVRVIAATNSDLERAMEERTFREDLFYRLNVFPIQLPPLRKRLEDVPDLIQHFLKDHGRTMESVHPDALQVLVGYKWPGNIRELENVVERACLVSDDEIIKPGDLPAHIAANMHNNSNVMPLDNNWTFPDEGIDLEDMESGLIIKAMEHAGGNKSKAARLLRISRRTLYSRIQHHQLRGKTFPG